MIDENTIKSDQIATVIIHSNGMIIVFGHDGQQIDALQGPINEALPKILAVGYTGPFRTACMACGLTSNVLEEPRVWPLESRESDAR